MSDYLFQATIKPPGQWRDAPWINIQAENTDELAAYLSRVFETTDAEEALPVQVAKAYAEYAAALNVVLTPASDVVAPPVQSAPVSPPAGPTGPPAAQCQHGPMIRKTGTVNKPGTRNHSKAWGGYFCPQNICPKQWDKD